MRKKIIFIPGIFNPKYYQTFWRNEAKKQGFDFVEFENPRYSYWSISQMEKKIEEGIEIFKKQGNCEIYVVCHSFGGILINSILQKLDLKYKKNIKKIITMGSPLKINFFGMKKRKNRLNYNENFVFSCPIETYGGYFDFVVPYLYTKYNTSKNHENVYGEHLYFLFSKKFIKKIIKNLN